MRYFIATLLLLRAHCEEVQPCSVCGDGKEVTLPDAIFSFPNQPTVPCGVLEAAGQNSMIAGDDCSSLADLLQVTCGCEDVSGVEVCSICGEGLVVGNPDAVFSFSGQSAITCGTLDAVGLSGAIPIDECALLPGIVNTLCDCQPAVSEPTGAPITPSIAVPTSTRAPATPDPTPEPTPEPTTGPTKAPAFQPTPKSVPTISLPTRPYSSPVVAKYQEGPSHTQYENGKKKKNKGGGAGKGGGDDDDDGDDGDDGDDDDDDDDDGDDDGDDGDDDDDGGDDDGDDYLVGDDDDAEPGKGGDTGKGKHKDKDKGKKNSKTKKAKEEKKAAKLVKGYKTREKQTQQS
jgi:hypothetical protein